MMHAFRTLSTLALLTATLASSAGAAGLAGSHASMQRQHQIAVENDFSFLRSPAQVREFVAEGRLVPVTASGDLALSGVSYPYARPEIARFVERLAAEYRQALGSRLVVTSLTRPTVLQPSNASDLSVHPAGMAVDLRVPDDARSRSWLEQKLLELERAGTLDVTRERRPSHFHVAVFPKAYADWAAQHPLAAAPSPAPAVASSTPARVRAPALPPGPGTDRATLLALLLALAAVAAGAATAAGRRRGLAQRDELQELEEVASTVTPFPAAG